MSIDVSLILNLHREARYIPRTLMSWREATAYARAQGISVELVIVLDRADAATLAVIEDSDLSTFSHVQIIETDHGSLGPARNSGCEVARGKYVRLCDGDDLFSFNVITAMFNEAELRGPKAIFICEWLFGFGKHYHIVRYFGLDMVTPFSLLDTHPFVSGTFFSRDLFLELKFSDLRLSAGYAFEDWHFNAEAIALGYEFFVARDTIFFYRQREESLLVQANRISTRQIPPSRLFEPNVFREVARDTYDRFSRGEHPRVIVDGKQFVESSLGRYLTAAANRIDPAIEPSLIHRGNEYFVFHVTNFQIGKRYFEICERLNIDKFDDVFLVPFFGKGGAERYLANIISELADRKSNILVILGEPHNDNEWLKRLPTRVVSVDLAPWLNEIGEHGLDLITLKLIQSVGRNARLHVRSSIFGQRFLKTYGRALKDNKRIFYRFGQEIRPDRDANFALPFAFQFLSENIEDLDHVITDSKAVRRYDRERISITPEKWRIIPPLLVPSVDRAAALRRAEGEPNRLLWASRLAPEKRPEVLTALASLLSEQRSDLLLEVHGVANEDIDLETLIDLPSVRFHGPYSRFEDIVNGDFLCFIYTSAYDGIPNVLLEAASMGLPIIAPDVGGIGEFIEHDETGILVPTLADPGALAEIYLAAIMRLEQEPCLRRRLAENAYDRLVARHGLAAFKQTVAAAFDLTTPWRESIEAVALPVEELVG